MSAEAWEGWSQQGTRCLKLHSSTRNPGVREREGEGGPKPRGMSGILHNGSTVHGSLTKERVKKLKFPLVAATGEGDRQPSLGGVGQGITRVKEITLVAPGAVEGAQARRRTAQPAHHPRRRRVTKRTKSELRKTLTCLESPQTFAEASLPTAEGRDVSHQLKWSQRERAQPLLKPRGAVAITLSHAIHTKVQTA